MGVFAGLPYNPPDSSPVDSIAMQERGMAGRWQLRSRMKPKQPKERTGDCFPRRRIRITEFGPAKRARSLQADYQGFSFFPAAFCLFAAQAPGRLFAVEHAKDTLRQGLQFIFTRIHGNGRDPVHVVA